MNLVLCIFFQAPFNLFPVCNFRIENIKLSTHILFVVLHLSFCQQGGCLGPAPGRRLGGLTRGCLGPDPGGRLGDLARGGPCPHPGGVCPGPCLGEGVSRPRTMGGVSQHALRWTATPHAFLLHNILKNLLENIYNTWNTE